MKNISKDQWIMAIVVTLFLTSLIGIFHITSNLELIIGGYSQEYIGSIIKYKFKSLLTVPLYLFLMAISLAWHAINIVLAFHLLKLKEIARKGVIFVSALKILADLFIFFQAIYSSQFIGFLYPVTFLLINVQIIRYLVRKDIKLLFIKNKKV